MLTGGVALLQPQRAQRRRQRERHEHRYQNGGRRRDAEAVEVLAHLARHERDGQENHDERERGGHHREADLFGRFDRRFARRHVLFLDVPENVLQHDNRIVNHDPRGERQREHRHVVQREAERLHDREGADDRCRDRECGDERDLRVSNEQKDDEAGQEAAEKQVQLDVFKRAADEARLVTDRLHAHVRGKRPANGFEPLQHAVDHVDGVGARLLLNQQRDGRLAIEPGCAANLLHGVDRPADVAKRHDRSVAR